MNRRRANNAACTFRSPVPVICELATLMSRPEISARKSREMTGLRGSLQ